MTAAVKPWRAAAWTPTPGTRPTDVKRAALRTGHDANAWARKHRVAGKTVAVWHETQLAPLALSEPAGTAPAATGRHLKAAGISLADTAAAQEWRDAADKAIADLARRGQPFTADDVRDLGVPDPRSPKAWGGRFLAAAANGIIVRVGYTPSRRASVHAHPIALWRGQETAA